MPYIDNRLFRRFSITSVWPLYRLALPCSDKRCADPTRRLDSLSTMSTAENRLLLHITTGQQGSLPDFYPRFSSIPLDPVYYSTRRMMIYKSLEPVCIYKERRRSYALRRAKSADFKFLLFIHSGHLLCRFA